MNGAHGRPTAAELLAAVAEFLEGEVRDAAPASVGFHALVAANALRIVQREILDQDASEPQAALARLGFADENALAEAIRDGKLDGRNAEILGCLRILVAHRVTVAHPGYTRVE